MLKLLALFLGRELKEMLKIFILALVLILFLDKFVPSGAVASEMVAICMLIICIFSPYLWKGQFAANLNWILLTPIRKRDIFLVHAIMNILGFGLFLSVCMLMFATLSYFEKSDFVSLILLKFPISRLFISAENSSMPGIYIGGITLAFSFFLNIFLGFNNPPIEQLKISQNIIVNKGRSKTLSAWIIDFIPLAIGIVAVAFWKYLFSYFTLFFVSSLAFGAILTARRSCKLLNISLKGRRQIGVIGIIVFTIPFLISFGVSIKNIKSPKSSPELVISELEYLGGLAMGISTKTFVSLLEKDINVSSISSLRSFKLKKDEIINAIDPTKIIDSKNNGLNFITAVDVLDMEKLNFDLVKLILEKGQRLIEQKECQQCIIVQLRNRLLVRKFTSEELNFLLDSPVSLFKLMGIYVAQFDNDADTRAKMYKLTREPPFGYLNETLITLSILTGHKILHDEFYLAQRSGKELEMKVAECEGHIVEEKDWPGAIDLDRINACIRKKINRSNYKDIARLQECQWLDKNDEQCTGYFVRKYFTKSGENKKSF